MEQNHHFGEVTLLLFTIFKLRLKDSIFPSFTFISAATAVVAAVVIPNTIIQFCKVFSDKRFSCAFQFMFMQRGSLMSGFASLLDFRLGVLGGEIQYLLLCLQKSRLVFEFRICGKSFGLIFSLTLCKFSVERIIASQKHGRLEKMAPYL